MSGGAERAARRIAAENVDWGQVIANGGPPCFHLDEKRKRFCLRAEAWQGHGVPGFHEYVPLAAIIREETGTQTTLETARRRHESIDRAPQHSEHTVFGQRVDIWWDEEAKCYVAAIAEHLTQGKTVESAIAATESVLKFYAGYALPAAPDEGGKR